MHRKPLSFINQRIYADGVEPQNLSQYVQELKERFNHIHRKMVHQEKSAIDLETAMENKTEDF